MKTIKIAHLADIHIRGLQRHGEMKTVFDAFCADAKKVGVDHIFVAGDIFHTKTMGITAEYIAFMTYVLRQLAAIAQVSLMLGNHDMNCVNLTRLDAISPIVDAINDPRVKLYKHSGVYEFHPGVNWCVFSLFDESRWEEIKPEKGKYNIACFHGSVRGALLESDWEMTEGMTVEFFEGFDLAMLGDIHRHQFLGTRVIDGKKVPWIGYPGSMAQQNFAEALDHGYLLWEIDPESKKHSVEFRTLPNPNPFVTVDWQGSVGKTVKELSEFPDGSRFRIKSGISITQKDVAQLIADLKQRHSAAEVAFKIEESIDRDKIKAGSITVARDDLRNLEVIIELMREYYEQEEITDSEWETIEQYVDSYLKAVQLEDAKNTKWSLKRLEWDNTFLYGEKNVLSFEKLNGITGIFAPNRMGKSSILGTLMYVLFNGTDRGSIKNLLIINNRRDFCKATALVNVNGTDYLFERQTVKMENKRGPFGVTGLNVFKMLPDGTKEELNGEQRFDTDKVIRGLIGTSDDFLITSVSAQDNLKKFIVDGATHRKQIISRFLDLDIFERIYEVANKSAANVRALHKGMTVRDWDTDIVQCKAEVKRLNEEHDRIKKAIPKLQKELLSVESELKELSEVKPVTLHQLNTQRSAVVSVQKKIERLTQESEQTKQTLLEKQDSFDRIVAACSKIDIDVLRARKVTFDRLSAELQSDTFLLKEQKARFDVMEKSVKKLTTVPCGDQFPTCPFIKDSHENKHTIDAQRVIVTNLEEKIARTSVEIQELDFSEDQIVKYEKALSLQVRVQGEINVMTMKLVTLERDLTQARDDLLRAQGELDDVETAFENEKNQKMMKVQAEQKRLKDEISSLESERNRNLQSVGKQESLAEQYAQDKVKFQRLDSELRIHELVANAFSKRGVPNHVIHSQLPLINSEIAKILHGIVNFTIELESDVETNALDVYINYGDCRRIIELGSGMEKVVASLALRVALTIITTLPKSDMFVVDEGFADLDPSGIDVCNRLIQSFKQYFRSIIIITHIDGIKDVVDNMIEITREEHDSKVFFE